MVDTNDLVRQVGELRADMAQINVLVDRLDTTIEKLTEVSINVSQLLAVQGSRIDQQDKYNNQMSFLIEKRRDEMTESIEVMHKRISSAEDEFRKELEKLNDRVIAEMKAIREENRQMNTAITNKITELEKWMWIVTGGAAVVGFLLSKVINFDKIF